MGLEPTTLRLKAARSTDWARKALTYTSLYRYMKIFWYRQDTMPTQCNIIWCPYNLRYSLWIFLCLFSTPLLSYFKKRASPGIEPGPPAPKAGILPLNYKALLLSYTYISCRLHTKWLAYIYIIFLTFLFILYIKDIYSITTLLRLYTIQNCSRSPPF